MGTQRDFLGKFLLLAGLDTPNQKNPLVVLIRITFLKVNTQNAFEPPSRLLVLPTPFLWPFGDVPVTSQHRLRRKSEKISKNLTWLLSPDHHIFFSLLLVHLFCYVFCYVMCLFFAMLLHVVVLPRGGVDNICRWEKSGGPKSLEKNFDLWSPDLREFSNMFL